MDDKKRQELKDLAQHLKKEAKNRKDKEKDKQKEERQKARQTKADKHKTYSLTWTNSIGLMNYLTILGNKQYHADTTI